MFRDGPLSRRPPEELRFGTGKCALGHVLVALSDKGIVSIVVRSSKAQLAGELRERFPKAALVHDEKGCAATVAKVLKYIAAPFKPFSLPLDYRGTELQKRVWEEVRKVPFGTTSSYSKIAEAIGAPKAIRAVASSCSRCMHAFAVPCHRVLHKGGDARDANGKRRLAWVNYEAKLAARGGR
jgi:AraC family transcriptional regulator, regulatory protein of adaptative response / methylated-DNA-[protein]-cysteine methyltransferase